MASKSNGPRRRTRHKFKKSTKLKITQFLKKFKEGDTVAIKIDSGSHDGMPFRRFHGLTGKIVGKRGRAYFVEIKDSGKKKKIISNPEHIKAV